MLKVLKFFGTPLFVLGGLYYTLIETPFFQGRIFAFKVLVDIIKKDEPS